MKRIIVRIKDAKEKLYSASTFFDAMLFGVDDARDGMDLVYCKNYYFTKTEGNLFDRHVTILKSIPIKFNVELINEEEK